MPRPERPTIFRTTSQGGRVQTGDDDGTDVQGSSETLSPVSASSRGGGRAPSHCKVNEPACPGILGS